MIIKAIEPLYYLGIDNPQDVIGWINHYHLSKGQYRPWKYGSHWLGTAHTKVDIFHKALRRLIPVITMSILLSTFVVARRTFNLHIIGNVCVFGGL